MLAPQLLIITAALLGAHSGAAKAYLRSLGRELQIARPEANLSMGKHELHASTTLPPNSLVFSIPPKYVLTVQEALGSAVGKYLKSTSRSLPKTLPRCDAQRGSYPFSCCPAAIDLAPTVRGALFAAAGMLSSLSGCSIRSTLQVCAGCGHPHELRAANLAHGQRSGPGQARGVVVSCEHL